jgi:hypothetical protein
MHDMLLAADAAMHAIKAGLESVTPSPTAPQSFTERGEVSPKPAIQQLPSDALIWDPPSPFPPCSGQGEVESL